MKTFKTLIMSLAVPAALNLSPAFAEAPVVTMYKDPNCGCCSKWADHMREAGFTVKEVHSGQMDRVKRQLGVPETLASCHTARVGNYLVEGHVPAADVQRLIDSKAEVVGLSVPGMPLGSPGMEGPYPAQRYDVVSFDHEGEPTVFARH